MHPVMALSVLGLLLAMAQEGEGGWTFYFGPELWDRFRSIDIDWKNRRVIGNSVDAVEPAFPSYQIASEIPYPLDPSFVRLYFSDREEELESIRKEVLLEETTNVPALVRFQRDVLGYLQQSCPLINRGWSFQIPDDAFEHASKQSPVYIAFDLVNQECFVDQRGTSENKISIQIPYLGRPFRDWLMRMFQLKANQIEVLRERSIVRERRTNIEYEFIDFVRGWFHEYEVDIPRIYWTPAELLHYAFMQNSHFLLRTFREDLDKSIIDEVPSGSEFRFSSQELIEEVFRTLVNRNYIPRGSRLVFDEMKHLLSLDCFSIEVPNLTAEEKDEAFEDVDSSFLPEDRSVELQEDGRWTVVYHLPWKLHVEGLADE